jgi:hypothetical protein
MSWFYEIKDSENRLVKREGGYATQDAAIEEGKKQATLFKDAGALAGGAVGSVMAGQDSSPVGTWTKNLGYGFGTVTYTTNGAVGTGFVHSAKYERGSVVETTTSKGTRELSRSEIEALFQSFISESKKKVG